MSAAAGPFSGRTAAAASGILAAAYVGLFLWREWTSRRSFKVASGVDGLVGETAMVRIASLSEITQCEIYGKLEMCNPGGSAKDRVALAVVVEAERIGRLRPGHPDWVVEGTSGSTGISLAVLCRSRGYVAHIVVPDDTSAEKVALLEALGAVVHKVRPAGIADSGHYVNVARRLAQEVNDDPSNDTLAVFADQFETPVNWRAHYTTTGPEIWRQANGQLDAFVTGAGTGGTVAGVSRFLKENLPHVQVVVADPPGSGIYNRIKFGVMFDTAEREGKRRRHQVDTLVEGIGLNRVTANLAEALPYIDDAERVSDADSLAMAHHLVKHDGLFVGSSSAVNCVATYRLAKRLGPGHTLVTILCDSGSRHLSKFWAAELQDTELLLDLK
ncbi:Cysteine synthase 2 [Wickerhamiella sorbophila]|uniref:cysteine synthase n=1 Tax=Wickerhamiella sorbophila TaxID=45607 RepID=A0A2T0FFV9_9ASCO|nr:Cysteine synthase 2 [Wickerhamiella sorbophila]PRT53878.1 Cysteine synthase 2 [Wickerhamiella sorbophila]